MARTRETFGSHANTAHAWAQQSHAYGRAGDRRMYFEGPTLYSYGSHFVLGHFLPDAYKGKRVVLVNADKYSVSTSRHQEYMYDALRGLGVLRVPVPDLTSLVRYGSPTSEQLNGAFDAMVSSLAGEAWESWRAPSASREAIEAFRLAFKFRRPIPADPSAWLAKRKEAAARKARFEKLANARSLVTRLDLDRVRSLELGPDDVTSSWRIQDRLNQLGHKLTDIRSARLTLGKAGRFPRLVAKASAALKLAKPIKAHWEECLNKRLAVEARERDLGELREVRDYLAKGGREPRAFWNYETAGRLWALALAEDMPDVADALGRKVQRVMLDREYSERFPRPYRPVTRDTLTLAQWYAGKGEAFQYRYGSFETPGGIDPCATRLRRKGEHLETSRGAVVPFRSAVRAFMFAQVCRAKGEAWQRNGHLVPVGPYQLDEISEHGDITAGCHHIAWSEIEACAVREIPDQLRPTFPLPVVIAQ
jgi:hypothetical protein